MKHYLEKIRRNKYIIVSIAFAVWILFLDASSIYNIIKQERKLQKLNRNIENYKKDIDRLKELEKLFASKKNLEKFAREEHNMREKDEDVFIIIEK